MQKIGVNRRNALRKLAAGGIGAATSTFWVESLSALAREQAAHARAAASAQTAAAWTPKILNRHHLGTVATLSELIIPQTETPGARAALVDRFVDTILQDAARADRNRFLIGLAWIDRRSTALFGRNFVAASPTQQSDLLTRLSIENSSEDRAGVDFFNAIKSMTITAYYTTEIGLRQELGDDGQMVLAEYKGCTHPEHQ